MCGEHWDALSGLVGQVAGVAKREKCSGIGGRSTCIASSFYEWLSVIDVSGITDDDLNTNRLHGIDL